MKQLAYLFAAVKRFDPMTIVGFLVPIALATLTGLAIYAHSRPIQSAITQTTDPSGGVTATTPVNPPTAAEVAVADQTILAYCDNDLRQDTSCAITPNSNVTAPGFVESGLKLSGTFATDGASPTGLALAKGSNTSWTVVWIGQSCIPQDVATENAVPSSLNICSS